jgi:hypothetical protein
MPTRSREVQAERLRTSTPTLSAANPCYTGAPLRNRHRWVEPTQENPPVPATGAPEPGAGHVGPIGAANVGAPPGAESPVSSTQARHRCRGNAVVFSGSKKAVANFADLGGSRRDGANPELSTHGAAPLRVLRHRFGHAASLGESEPGRGDASPPLKRSGPVSVIRGWSRPRNWHAPSSRA